MTVAELDPGTGEWDISQSLVDRVAVIQWGTGTFMVYVQLPEKVARSGRPLVILAETVERLATMRCTSTAKKAFEFYCLVFDELTSFGY